MFIAVYYVLAVLDVTVFARTLELVNRIAGAIIIVLALQTLGVLRFGVLMRELRVHITPACGAGGALRALGWTVTSAAATCTSSGSDTITGPGRPESAVRTARCSSSGIRLVSWTSTDHLVMGSKNRTRSISSNASRW